MFVFKCEVQFFKQLNASLKEQGMSLSLKSVKSVDTSTVVGSSDHTVVGESLIPCIYPSQIQSESSPLKASSISKSVGAMKNSVKLVIRQVMPLLPASAGKETTRQFKATVDSTLYVYPIQLERFQNRLDTNANKNYLNFQDNFYFPEIFV
jgi:hypothetical protein